MQMLFIHYFSEISHLSLPLLLLVTDMFIISHMKEYYREAGRSPASCFFLPQWKLTGVQQCKASLTLLILIPSVEKQTDGDEFCVIVSLDYNGEQAWIKFCGTQWFCIPFEPSLVLLVKTCDWPESIVSVVLMNALLPAGSLSGYRSHG